MYIRRVPRHMFVCSAHIPAVSRHYCACRTTPPGLFCKHRCGATQTRCCASSTGCRFVTESTTSWLWWLTRSTAPVYLHTCVINPRESTRTLRSSDTTAHRTIYQDWAREACFPMLSSIWNSLPSFITNIGSLATFKSRLKTYFFPFIFRL